MEGQLVSAVHDSLSLHLHDNAKFLCERLYAGFPSEPNKLLLATCYYRANQAYRAYHLLADSTCPQSRYMLALSCIELGKHAEAEAALARTASVAEMPNTAAELLLLGKICSLTNRPSAATDYFRQALTANPQLWVAYQELCRLGAGHIAEDVLERCQLRILQAGIDEEGAVDHVSREGGITPGPSAPARTPTQTPVALSTMGKVPAARHSSVTPGNDATPFTPPQGSQVPSGPPPLQRPNQPHAPVCGVGVSGRPISAIPHVSAKTAPGTIDGTPGFGHRRKNTGGGGRIPRPTDDGRFKLRKVSDNLFQDPPSHALRSSKLLSYPDESDASCTLTVDDTTGLPLGSPSNVGMAELLELLARIGEGVQLLSDFRCRDAIASFQKLPSAHYQTAWVLAQVAKAYFEKVDYPTAARTFEDALRADPTRMEDLEIYSTVLWHMKKEVELSNLAKRTTECDRQSPQAWCVMGNCFSLQKEHETALRYFQRALQLDPHFTYAHTLCGHEYFANEDFDKGLSCYRKACSIDRRHYNAWYGIGHIYLRQEKYDLAESHFRRALSINPSSSVLYCYLGMALQKLGRPDDALEHLDMAISADRHNPLAKFEKAAVIMSLEQYEPALKELQELREVLPREASVFFQIGKICKKLGRLDEALANFNIALDLKPPSSDANLIKSAIDKIHISDESEDEEI